jgi:hypothetical protein
MTNWDVLLSLYLRELRNKLAVVDPDLLIRLDQTIECTLLFFQLRVDTFHVSMRCLQLLSVC